MSNADLTRFSEAVIAQHRDDGMTAEPRRFTRVAVLGGSADAQMVAALCLAGGATVTLFSAIGAELDALTQAGGVTLRGDGAVGTFQFNRNDAPSIATTAHLDVALHAAELIFIGGDLREQRLAAMLVARHLRDGQVLVLAPGRSFGALEIRRQLRLGGCRAAVGVVECQNPPFWCQPQGATLHLSACQSAVAAALPTDDTVIAGLQTFFPNLVAADSLWHGSFADGSGLVETPALLLGGPATPDGQPAVPAEAAPLAENHTFRHLIGARHHDLIDTLASERRAVAACFGVRDLPDTDAWIAAHAGAPSGAGSRAVPDANQARRLLRSAVAGSLQPLTHFAAIAEVDTPLTEAMIALATTVIGDDLTAGRDLNSLGLTATSPDEARRAVDAHRDAAWTTT